MSSPKIFTISESENEIKKVIKANIPIVSNRFKALLVFKRYEKTGVSKRQVADEIGINQNSIQTWRSMYIKGGAALLKKHSNTGYKPPVINNEQEKVFTRSE